MKVTDEKVRSVIKKILATTDKAVSGISQDNAVEVSSLVDKFSSDLQRIFSRKKAAIVQEQVWRKFPNMTEEDILAEFNNLDKYPDLDSIKRAVKGYLDFHKAGKIKTRETLIAQILETYRRGSFISGSNAN